ncbi:MAG: hypothetical protein AB8E82_09050 [Aureispira sp.]
MTALFTQMWLLIGLCVPFFMCAQDVSLPHVQSQYLYQAKNSGAPILRIAYEDQKVQLHSTQGRIDFSQENMTQLLEDHKRTHNPIRNLLAASVRLHAPANLPISYINDLFFWLRIGGCNTLYLAVIEDMQPTEIQYLRIPIAPFTLYDEIYKDVEAAQKVHPNTSFLDAKFDWEWYFEQIKTQPIAYVPSLIHPLSVEKRQVVFQEQLVNPMVLSTLLQTALAQHYQNSYNKATPKQYWSLLIEVEAAVQYQDFIAVMGSIVEGYHLYWEELAFAKYQQTYLELEPEKRWEVQQAAPFLPLYYDNLQAQELAPLYELTPALWAELKDY